MTERSLPTGPVSPADLTAESPFTLPGFFAELADGRLLGGRCDDCGTQFVPPRPACYACGSRAVAVAEQPRTGDVVSYTAVHRPPTPFAELAPYTLAVVELDSGARLTGRLTVPYDEAAVDMPVQLSVEEPSPALRAASLAYETDWPIHVFEPR